MRMISDFEFKLRTSRMLGAAQQIVTEALGPNCTLEHKHIFVRELLARRPALIATLPLRAENESVGAAIEMAREELSELLSEDAYLAQVQHCDRECTYQWLKISRTHNDNGALWAECVRAGDVEKAELVYAAKRALHDAKGAEYVAAQIERIGV